MEIVLIILAVLIIGPVVLHLAGTWRYNQVLQKRLAALRAGPINSSVKALPSAIESFARRSGAGCGPLTSEIILTQIAEMRLQKGAKWVPLAARQWIATQATGFVWEAAQPLGPVAKFRVIDSFAGGEGVLHARLLGSIPIATAKGEDVDAGEAMRYLAELAWAPDAILGNAALAWEQVSASEVRVWIKDWPATTVTLTLNGNGDIVAVHAMRPVRDAAGDVLLREWRGRFSDYRQVGDRRVPAKAEVGYVYDDGYEAYWRGEVTSLSIESAVKL